MQVRSSVSNSVSNRYYTPYQTNTSVKYCAGFTHSEDGKLTPDETTENPVVQMVSNAGSIGYWKQKLVAIQELMKEEQERKEAEEVKKESMIISDASTLLTTESTSCVYETADPNDEDLRYITWYTEEKIFCRKAGQTEGDEWSITFENREQYDKVMEFIGQFPSDWNMRFAAHENFWNDFLSDEIDMDGFMEFIGGTNKGVPDFSITIGDSMYIDKDKMQWAKYTNPLGARFYTAEEMHRMQMEIIAANEAKLTKLTDSYGEVYKQNHPDYNGERIFCEYPGGPLYTADEVGRLKWQQFLDDMNMTEEEMRQKQEEWRKQMGYSGY